MYQGSKRQLIQPLRHIKQYHIKHPLNIAAVMDYFKSFKGERYVFMNKDQSFKLVGIGHHSLFVDENINPAYIEKEFIAHLKQSSVSEDILKRLKLFGGFHFDENESPNFSSFHKSHFVLPYIQLIEMSGELVVLAVDYALDIDALVAHMQQFKHHVDKNTLMDATDIDLELFKTNANKAIMMMQQGELKKVVLSRKRKITMQHSIDTLSLITHAEQSRELSYFALMESGEHTFVTKTPEQLVRVEDGMIHTNAIAGTMGKDIKDAKVKLSEDTKNLYEHQIVVESIQADLAPYTNKVILKDAPDILDNQFFYHLYTPIQAELSTGGLLEVTESLHPTPALGGYPKAIAMDFLTQASEGRGLYGAPLGYMDIAQEGEFIVAIRSMVIEDNRAVLYAGCGIVKSSIVESEVHETEIKFKPMLEMLGVI
ncbi:isochorismate synthase [Macrococcoides caseolyticum]|uniref:isochorismate synthase n=1 Tax=Macrococcoides caseolyticum TaxID=69966 RepID=UPI001EED3274|nr:isochorismate synthase [Macrococcus caseolyticus]